MDPAEVRSLLLELNSLLRPPKVWEASRTCAESNTWAAGVQSAAAGYQTVVAQRREERRRSSLPDIVCCPQERRPMASPHRTLLQVEGGRPPVTEVRHGYDPAGGCTFAVPPAKLQQVRRNSAEAALHWSRSREGASTGRKDSKHKAPVTTTSQPTKPTQKQEVQRDKPWLTHKAKVARKKKPPPQRHKSSKGGAASAPGDSELILPCGLTQRQLNEMMQRELTPEDYEILLLLDAKVTPATCRTCSAAQLERFPEIAAPVHTECGVCLFEFEAGEKKVKQLPCCSRALFHPQCIFKWLVETKNQCPSCLHEYERVE